MTALYRVPELPTVFFDQHSQAYIRPKEILPVWRPSAYAIIRNRRRGWLFVRSHFVGSLLCLPGGEVEMGEHIPAAIGRECYEETGYEVGALDKSPFLISQNNFYDAGAEHPYRCVIAHFYTGELLHEVQNTQAIHRNEIKEVLWVPYAQLPAQDFFPFFQAAIDVFLPKKTVLRRE